MIAILRQALLELPPAFYVGFAAAFGLFVGSFTNVVIYRLPRNCLSVNAPKRSFCPKCRTQLTWYDNLPVVSWLTLLGRCRYCKAPISPRYPLVEGLVGALFAFTVWRVLFADGPSLAAEWQAWLTVLTILLMIGVLVPMALIDLDLQQIPDELSLAPLLVFVPLAAHPGTMMMGLDGSLNPLIFGLDAQWLDGILSACLAGGAGAAFIYGIGKVGNVMFRKGAEAVGGESMGFGDVKLLLLLGVMLGWPKLLAAFFIAVALGAILGIGYRLATGNRGIPFGPFLATGALVSMLAAPELTRLYKGYMDLIGAAP